MGLGIYFHHTKVAFEGEQTSSDDINNFTDKVDEIAREKLGKKVENLLEPLCEAWEILQTDDYWRNVYNERYFAFVAKLRPLIAANYDWKIYPYTNAILDLPELEELVKKDIELAYDKYDAYFFKVNFIFYYFESTLGTMHDQWFAFVRPEDVDDLIDRCERVLRNHGLANQLLPTQSGFFFGDTDFNDVYFENVKDCLKQMRKYRKLLKEGVTGYVFFSW